MRQITTEGDLDLRQARALTALAGGATVTGAAKSADVSRSTVHRWLNEPRFTDAYEVMKRRRLAEIDARIAALADAALATVEKAIAEGDVRAALAVLRGLGALDGQPRSYGP
jgi:transposase